MFELIISINVMRVLLKVQTNQNKDMLEVLDGIELICDIINYLKNIVLLIIFNMIFQKQLISLKNDK